MEAASSWTTTPDRAASVPDTRNPAVKVSQCPHTQARGDAPSPWIARHALRAAPPILRTLPTICEKTTTAKLAA